MKKILVTLLVLFSVLTVGCTEKSDGVETLSKKEYAERLSSTIDEMFSKYGNDYLDITENYAEMYEKSPDNYEYQEILESFKTGEIKYKEMGEQLSKFKSKDKEINQLHEKLIKTCIDKSNYYKEIDELEDKITGVGIKENVNELEIEAGTVPENLISQKEYSDIEKRIYELGGLIDGVTLEDIWSELEVALGENLD
ncbi:hypothetical protein KQI18_03645 [Clostridioides mangenotii]|uniref:hypothetical protein n=1 Tax=Metaclostridioides mangenotii TaxID=1540 RepID=UPI001C11C19D|nr:hypothetical protein [Clostridioides mangenotii]MBU5306872.1 hypothetical protein [Clostridioides mangenotii]